MWKSLGSLIILGNASPNLVRATVNLRNPQAPYPVNAMMFQQRKGNLGWIYLYDDPAGGDDHLLGSLAVPTNNTCPSATVSVMYAPAGANPVFVFVGGDNPGEKCQLSVLL